MKQHVVNFLSYFGLKTAVKKIYLSLLGPRVILSIKDKSPQVVAICHPDYRGVRSATAKLTDNLIEISEVANGLWATKVAKIVSSYKPKIVIISGYSEGYDLIAEKLKSISPETRILFFVHSSFTWFDNYPNENHTFSRVLDLNKQGIVEKIGFCKNDLAVYFSNLGYRTTFLMNRFDSVPAIHKDGRKGTIKIGVWGNNWWHRNILNQVIAALMIPGAEIHVNELKEIDFIDNKRVVRHGFLPKKEFLEVFSKMDINLYVSFTDCFPMTLIESMQYGIPAIASDTSDVYAYSTKLKELLTTSAIDSPIRISEKISEVISNYELINKQILEYLPLLEKKIESSIAEFLNE